MDTIGALLPFVLILVAFYALIVRPARNRTRAAVALQEQLAPGQEVLTQAGLLATVTSVQDDVVVLEISPGVRARFVKGAVVRIVDRDIAGDTAGERAGDTGHDTAGNADGPGPGAGRPAASTSDEPT